ncbi:YjgN family protein [Primorskyibacter sp. 2E107]|uniref:YjgN family protein n=1 Tax=Primorskyibacter sp. 2E107 TaxID=3403458 RepID=UPI003AF73414
MHSPQSHMNISYNGERGALFGLAFRTGCLTLITLGIYRFWQKTRIRKYIWSSVSAGGDTLEYTGTGLEKFLGFLIAVVFLAVYLGAIQMLLFYFGISMMAEPATMEQSIAQIVGLYVTIFAVLPFVFFATYRARRYKMARTRWRGIRFGMEKGALGYVWRAIGHGFLTIITLGILLPRQTYHLEKYMTDRSWFGDEPFRQSGKWTALYGAMTHIFIGIGLLIMAAVLGALGLGIAAGIAGVVGYVWLIVGGIVYGVRSFGYLTSQKTLGDQVGFISEPRTGFVIKTWVIGVLMSLLILALFGAAIGALVFGATLGTGGEPTIAVFVISAIGYVALLVVSQAVVLAWIVQPILGHFISTVTVTNPEALDIIHQRAAETGIDADGFADALDIGGAI